MHAHEITLREVETLRVIACSARQNISEVARGLGVSRQSMCAVINRLERLQFIESCPAGGRPSNTLFITPLGRSALLDVCCFLDSIDGPFRDKLDPSVQIDEWLERRLSDFRPGLSQVQLRDLIGG